jgi:acyl-CoA synthetase (AMP-forming)/AMP-acid ligase II/alpha-beta hydrolase superfamily lysophospholipase
LVIEQWSRTITDARGRTWHYLDTATDDPRLTLLCVHGNPTWSYLWRGLLAAAPRDIRVLAVDQLQMGWSERIPGIRRLAARIDDLVDLTDALDLRGPVVTVAHDWGGPISLGWVLHQRAHGPADVRGVVLLNTAVHRDTHTPPVIRLAHAVRGLTVSTSVFLRGTLALSRVRAGRPIDRATAEVYIAPYRGGHDRRRAIGAFIADIPLTDDHPSAGTLASIQAGVATLDDIHVFLAWGARDPVFSDRYLRDLERRIPHADVHRYPHASHLVIEDDPRVITDVLTWVRTRVVNPPADPPADPPAPVPDLNAALESAARTRPDAPALTMMGGRGGAEPTVMTWSELTARVQDAAGHLRARGVHGRVAMLIPPGPDAIVAIYACWRIGASVVIADRGLGVRGMRRALQSAAPAFAIAVRRARALAASIRVPTIAPTELRGLASAVDLPPDPGPSPDALAAVVFTSGSTGPAKGVRYRHAQVARTCELLRAHYSLDVSDVLVAAFAPWAILGPALGLASVIPDMDVTEPASLRADALAAAVRTARGTVLWASPAALTNVVRTAHQGGPIDDLRTLRLVLCAGAPVPPGLLEQVAALVPDAEVRTPYGMTEVLPATDVAAPEIVAAGVRDGVLVGTPLPGVRARVEPLAGGHLGEILLAAPHMRDGYDGLWGITAESPPGWHRTGDVGWLDGDGRLWLSGRRSHVIETPLGPVAPVGIEQQVQRLSWVRWCAAVGVGPSGTQSVVVIVIPSEGRGVWAGYERSAEVRAAVRDSLGLDVAAVLQRSEFPVDVRHQAKIDRAVLAQWAESVLAGHR